MPTIKKPKKIVAGSISGKAINDDDLAQMPVYMAKAERLLAGEVLISAACASARRWLWKTASS